MKERFSVAELSAIPVKDMSEDDAVLFIWTTAAMFPEALQVIKSWGFVYKTNIVWDKVKSNKGNYTLVSHEHLLLATRGSCLPDIEDHCSSIQKVEKGKDSEKPEEFRDLISNLYNYGNKLQIFADEDVEGWEVYNPKLESVKVDEES